MTKNPILDELRQTREKLLAEAGGTIEGLVARLQQDERLSHRQIVRPKNRTTRCAEAAKSGVSAVDRQTRTSPTGER